MTEPSTAEDLTIDELIEKLLAERQQMLILFCTVAGLSPFTHDKPIETELEEFCEILIDYVSVGHFETYERILTDNSNNEVAVLKLANQVYPHIVETTDTAISFNDKYDSSNTAVPRDDLDSDLSELIGDIAIRIELEDRLINVMRGVGA